MSPIRLVPAVVGILLIAACAERPATESLADAIVEAAAQDPTLDVTGDQARCIADHLLGSGLSDTTLEGLAEDFRNPEVLSAERDRVEPAVADAALECITSG